MGHFMLAPNLKTAIDGLAHLIENADAVLPFTGAGISTECGIPDFRSPGGIWARMQPIPFEAFMASQEMRNEAWRRRFAMADEFQGARPGRGHRALASLYQAGKAPAVITQNIDNLHQESGIAPADVVEFMAIPPTPCASGAPPATNCLGSVKNSRPPAAAPRIAIAAAISRPRPSRSGRPCRKPPWPGRKL